MANTFAASWVQFPNEALKFNKNDAHRFKCPSGSGSAYYNFKGFFSIVLLAVVDSNYKVLLVDCGGKGKISDAGIVKISYFVVVKLVN